MSARPPRQLPKYSSCKGNNRVVDTSKMVSPRGSKPATHTLYRVCSPAGQWTSDSNQKSSGRQQHTGLQPHFRRHKSSPNHVPWPQQTCHADVANIRQWPPLPQCWQHTTQAMGPCLPTSLRPCTTTSSPAATATGMPPSSRALRISWPRMLIHVPRIAVSGDCKGAAREGAGVAGVHGRKAHGVVGMGAIWWP